MLACLRPWARLTHVHGYDINCQYRKKYNTRVQQLMKDYPALRTIQNEVMPFILPAIGKFHAPAHTASCRCKFSYNFLPGVGMTDGEACERIWSTLNLLALRAKEMSPGHRHDFINEYHSFMNVTRVHAMRKCTCRLRAYHAHMFV